MAGIVINFMLIVVNLIPLPPLDGSRIVAAFLSPAMAMKYHKLERWGLLIMLALIFTLVQSGILEYMVGFLLSLVDLLVSG